MVEQLGVAMMPLWRARWSALTSGTTSGTSGSARKALDLSITTAPAATAWGTNSWLTAAAGGEEREVDAGEGARGELADGAGRAPEGEPRAARALARQQAQLADREGALLEDGAHGAADDAGGADDGDGVGAVTHAPAPGR